LANLLEDFQTAYEQVSRGEAIHLPPKTTSFKQWAERLGVRAVSRIAARAGLLAGRAAKTGRSLARDYSGERTRWLRRTPYQSHLIRKKPKLYSKFRRLITQINDVLLTLQCKLLQWTGERTLLVEQEGHGREDVFDDVDLSRTIGWFTIFPVVLKLEEASHPSDALKAVKDHCVTSQIGGSAMVCSAI